MHSRDLPAQLRHLRAAKGLSQRALAEAAELTRMSIVNYENGNSVPSVVIAGRLADALGVTVDELLGGDPIETAIRRIVARAPQPTDEQIDRIRRALAVA